MQDQELTVREIATMAAAIAGGELLQLHVSRAEALDQAAIFGGISTQTAEHLAADAVRIARALVTEVQATGVQGVEFRRQQESVRTGVWRSFADQQALEAGTLSLEELRRKNHTSLGRT